MVTEDASQAPQKTQDTASTSLTHTDTPCR